MVSCRDERCVLDTGADTVVWDISDEVNTGASPIVSPDRQSLNPLLRISLTLFSFRLSIFSEHL